jgi:hypothetical protein
MSDRSKPLRVRRDISPLQWLLLAIAAMGAFASRPAAAAELEPFTASFSITWHGMSAGTARVQLQRLPDGRWSYESVSTARGLFRLAMPAELRSRSLFAIRDGHIIPESFTAEDGTSSTGKDQDVRFDWDAQRVTGTAERHHVDLPLKPGLLDSLSVQVALMHELLSGRTPQYFVLLDKEKIKDYNYSAQGQETLQTVLGEKHTVIFSSSRPGSTDATWFWCAPDMGYLPLKVERREGKSVQWSMTLLSASRD